MSNSTKISWKRLTKTLLALLVLISLLVSLVLTVSWWLDQRSKTQADELNLPGVTDGSNQPYDKTQILIDDTLEPLEIVEKPAK